MGRLRTRHSLAPAATSHLPPPPSPTPLCQVGAYLDLDVNSDVLSDKDKQDNSAVVRAPHGLGRGSGWRDLIAWLQLECLQGRAKAPTPPE